MRITIDTKDRRPVYVQVADEIKKLIARGELTEGQVLPPVRQLAADLDVNLNTIATAYRELQDAGLISIRHGFGARVSARRTRSTSLTMLRRMMSGVLTEMVLADMPRATILEMVAEELGRLQKESSR